MPASVVKQGTRLIVTALVLITVGTVIGLRATDSPTPPLQLAAAGSPGDRPTGGDLLEASADEFQAILGTFRGTPVVINVWASWCAPCRSEMPLLVAAASDGAADVAFLGVASADRRDDAERFLQEFGVPYPNVLDSSGEIGELVELIGLPATLVVDREGRLAARHDGVLNAQVLAELIAAAA